MSEPFEMQIADMFQLGDKIAFTGTLSTKSNFLKSSLCKLVLDGKEVARFKIEGENLFTNNQQSVWTRENLSISREEILSHDAWLYSVSEP